MHAKYQIPHQRCGISSNYSLIVAFKDSKELMLLKHKLDLEKLSKKDAGDPKAVEAEGMVSYSQESIIKAMNTHDEDEEV